MDMVRLDSPPELAMPIGEAMFSQRATRRLDPDRPVSDAQLQIILNAASKAPNGGNAQPARCLVIRDSDAICEFGKLYFEAWWDLCHRSTRRFFLSSLEDGAHTWGERSK